MLMPSIFSDSLFDGFFDDFSAPVKRNRVYTTSANSLMKTDVKETDNGYELEIELPGCKKENVKAELKDGYMKISASYNNSNDEKDKDGKFIRRERYSGSCSRSFFIGKDITENDIAAKFEDGILKISVPKKQPQPKIEENKYITIE